MATSNPGDTCVYQSSTKFTDPVHQSPGAYAAHWIMWLVPVLPLFAVQWFIKLVCDVLINVVYEKRVYRPFADRTATRQVLDVLSQLPLTLRIGGELFDSRMAPNKLISFTGIVARSPRRTSVAPLTPSSQCGGLAGWLRSCPTPKQLHCAETQCSGYSCGAVTRSTEHQSSV